MSQRIKFFLAQFIWSVLAVGMAVFVPNNGAEAIFPIIAIFAITGFLLNWGKSQDREGKGDNTLVLAGVSGFMWLIYVGAVIAGAMELGAVIIPLAVILMIPLLAMNAFMWDFFGKIKGLRTTDTAHQATDEIEKRKRDRIDSVIRDLSDEDLLRLKHRLMNRDIVEDDLEYMLGDDGEIVPMNEHKRR